MYRNTFERAFSDVAPKTSDEEFARKILNAADRQKPRTAHRKAVILPLAAAIVAIGTITASAAGGLDLFGAFRSYFSQRKVTAPYADLSAAGMAKYDEVFDAGDYTVQINGLIADSHYAYLSYDVTYRDKKYFDGGEVAEKYREGSPVIFFETRTDDSFAIHTTGWGEPIAESGATVSYVALFAGEFTPDPETGEYPFALTVTCVDDPSFIAGECTFLKSFPVNLSVPPAKERAAEINGEIPLPDGRTTILEKASFGPLSLTLRFDNDYFYSYWSRYDNGDSFELKMKDGTVIDLKHKSTVLSPAEGYEWKDGLSDDPQKEPVPDEAARENTPAVTTAVQESAPVTTTLPQSWARPMEFGMPCVLELGYGTAIDPAEIAEIEIFGQTFSVK